MAVEATDQWSVLLPVIVGGGLALLGVAVGPAITQWLESRTASAAKRTQRFEELLEVLQRQDEWLELQRGVNAYGEDHEIQPEPLYRALSIAALYFPQFLPDLQEIATLSRACSLWTSQAAMRRLEGRTSEINEDFQAVHGPYVVKTVQVRRRIIEYAVARKGKL